MPDETTPDGIRVPSYVLPVIGAIVGYIAGALVAADFAAYWRPALVPIVTALGGMFVAVPIARNRLAAQRTKGQAEGIEAMADEVRSAHDQVDVKVEQARLETKLEVEEGVRALAAAAVADDETVEAALVVPDRRPATPKKKAAAKRAAAKRPAKKRS